MGANKATAALTTLVETLRGGCVMKRLFIFLLIAGFVLIGNSTLFAGGIDNKHNFSAEWVRTLNRNAATDSADAAVYNPAGVVWMGDGLYTNLSIQYAMKDYSNTFGGTEYSTDEPDIVPSLFAVYRKGKWAGFAAFNIPCGGGSVDYKDGDVTTLGLGRQIIAASGGFFNSIKDQGLEGETYYLGYTLGGAFIVNECTSISLGIRYIDARREFKGFATLSGLAPDTTYSVEYEETDSGVGGIVGLNWSPIDELNIGLRYETKTSLNLETDVKEDTVPGGLVVDGSARERDLPALFGAGVSYKIGPSARVEADFTYYLNNGANWDDTPITSGDETEKDNGYDIGLAFEYTFNNQWKGSAGYMYTDVGIEPDNMSIEAPELDCHTIGAGVEYSPISDMSLNLGVLKTFYDDAETSSGITLEKDVVIMAFGIQYKFM
jgi:long-chain fatty acid transport protein